MSRPIPRHAFVHRWLSDERALQYMPLKQRHHLLQLTAASGSAANLQLALVAAGCPAPTPVFESAAAVGHLHLCELLRRRNPSGRRHQDAAMARAAARAGHAAVVRWLLQLQKADQTARVSLTEAALAGAAEGGHRALCEDLLAEGAEEGEAAALGCATEAGHVELSSWLLGRLLLAEFAVWDDELLAQAAYGFDLAALRRLYHGRLGGGATEGSEAASEEEEEGLAAAMEAAQEEFKEYHGRELAMAALVSPTCDWRAKLEWLEAQGCLLGQEGLDLEFLRERQWELRLFQRLDAVERVALLRGRQLLLGDAGAAAKLVSLAAAAGRVDVLAELLAAGCPVKGGAVHEAARRGRLHVLRYLAGPEAGLAAAEAFREAAAAGAGAELARDGAESGSLEVVEWLAGRGCRCEGAGASLAAARVGSGELLEWLAGRSCPMEGQAYLEAIRNGDFATLRCLRRLGCLWSPPGGSCDTFDAAVREPCCGVEVLTWLLAERCPVDWRRARVTAKARAEEAGEDAEAAAVLAWVESHVPAALELRSTAF